MQITVLSIAPFHRELHRLGHGRCDLLRKFCHRAIPLACVVEPAASVQQSVAKCNKIFGEISSIAGGGREIERKMGEKVRIVHPRRAICQQGGSKRNCVHYLRTSCMFE